MINILKYYSTVIKISKLTLLQNYQLIYNQIQISLIKVIYTEGGNLIQYHTLHLVVMSLQFFLAWNISSFFVFHDLDISEPFWFLVLCGTALDLNGFYSHTLVLLFIQCFSDNGLDFIFENHFLLLALFSVWRNWDYFFFKSKKLYLGQLNILQKKQGILYNKL